MNIIFVLIAFSILLAGGFLAAFIYFVKKGQFDDTYTPSVRILLEDESPKKEADDSTESGATDMSDKSHT